MLEMADREILPAVSGYCDQLCDAVMLRNNKRCRYESETLDKLTSLLEAAYDARCELEEALNKAGNGQDEATAVLYRDQVLPVMRRLREACDGMEMRMPAAQWPFPTYGDILFSVK